MSEKQLLKILIVTIIFTLSACQKSIADNANISLSTNNLSNQISSQMQAPDINSPIRKIDFKNFIYSNVEDYEGFKLQNGEKTYVHQKEDGINLYKIDYLDVTNDEEEDAIIYMSIQTGGSAMPNIIYIYTLQNSKPRCLWSFMTGDRAVGGFKSIYRENDQLVIELFGDNRFINDKWKFNSNYEKYAGDGRLTRYTKTYFKWNGKKFVAQNKPELFDYNPQTN